MKTILPLVALVVAMGWGDAAWAAPGAPAAAGDGAEPLPDAPLVLEARPASVQLSRSVNFDQDGNISNEHNSLSINLNIVYDDAIRPVAYGDLELTRVITSSGERLDFDPDQNSRGARRIHRNRRQDGRPFFNSYFNLPVPERPCESIRLIEGQMTLTLPHGEIKQATLAPWSRFVDQRVRVTNVPGSMIVLRKQENGNVKIEFDRALDQQVTEVVFVDGKNAPLEARQQGSGSGGSLAYRYYAVDVPDDGGVWVRLYPQTRQQRASFAARDVPMPGGADGQPAFDLAVKAVDLGQVNAEARPEALEVEIVGEVKE